MTSLAKRTLAIGFAGILATAAIVPAQAQSRAWTAAGAGFVAGTILGAAASPYYSGYAGPYAYGPGYDAYAYDRVSPRGAYAAAPYNAPYSYANRGCWTDGGGGRPDYSCGY